MGIKREDPEHMPLLISAAPLIQAIETRPHRNLGPKANVHVNGKTFQGVEERDLSAFTLHSLFKRTESPSDEPSFKLFSSSKLL
jgi:hypothetical protein